MLNAASSMLHASCMSSEKATMLQLNELHGDEHDPYSAAAESQGEEGSGVVAKGVEDLQINHICCWKDIEKTPS